MDGRNGWTAPGYAAGSQDKTIINRIMLKFRPIAPKPVTDGSVSGSNSAGNHSDILTQKRTKRKYVRVKRTEKKCNGSSINNSEEEKNTSAEELHGAVVTLQLLPPVRGLKDSSASRSATNLDFPVLQPPLPMNSNNNENNAILTAGLLDPASDRQTTTPARRAVESWVVVDRMTNTWVDFGGLGRTDVEKMKSLEVDTCPGLISDGLNRVQWVNLAYRRMVDPWEGEEVLPADMVVRLLVNDKFSVPWQVFACTVRVVYTWREEKQSQTMPCDVWKMDFGGFAWRLDANAALSLGR